MQIGPIQLLAFAFDRIVRFEGQILRELDELRGHGLIWVVDLLFVMKEADGTIHALQEQDMLGYDPAQFGAVLGRMLGLSAAEADGASLGELLGAALAPEGGQGLGLDAIQAVAAAIPPQTAVALVLIEHDWAIGLGAAIGEAGGRMVAQGFLTRDALLAVGRELRATVEAEAATERAAAMRGAAMLDTLTTLAAAEEVQREAMAEAITTVVGIEAFRATVAAEAVRALIVAGLLAEADAVDAIDVLFDAELITQAALDEAAHAADDAAAELAGEW